MESWPSSTEERSPSTRSMFDLQGRRSGLSVSVVALAVFVLVSPPAVAFQLSPLQIQELDSLGSVYKVVPDMVPKLEKLLEPTLMDGFLPGGVQFTGQSVDRFLAELVLIGPAGEVRLVLLPPLDSLPYSFKTGSFHVWVDGELPKEAMGAVRQRLEGNDHGDFWRAEPPGRTTEEIQGGDTGSATGGRPVDNTLVTARGLVGEAVLLVLLLGGLLILPAGASFVRRHGRIWWMGFSLSVVLPIALGMVASGGFAVQTSDVIWAPHQAEPWSLMSAILLALSRMFVITDRVGYVVGLVGLAFLGAGFYASRWVVGGKWSSTLVGTLVIASSPVLLGQSEATFSMTAMLAGVAWSLAMAGLLRETRDPWVHLFMALVASLTLYARPEASLLLVVFPWVLKHSWKMVGPGRWDFWVAALMVCTAAVLRLWTLPEESAAFPLVETGFHVSLLLDNLWFWVSHRPAVTLVLMGLGLAMVFVERVSVMRWLAPVLVVLVTVLFLLPTPLREDEILNHGSPLLLVSAWLSIMGMHAVRRLPQRLATVVRGGVVVLLTLSPCFHPSLYLQARSPSDAERMGAVELPDMKPLERP